MKKLDRQTMVLIIITLLLTAGCIRHTPPPVPTPAPMIPVATPVSADLPDVPWSDRELYRSGLTEEAQSVLAQLPGATVYQIDLAIPTDLTQLQGHETVYYTNQEEVPLNEIYFRLFPNAAGGKATVSEVQIDGETVSPIHELQETAIRLRFPEALEPGVGVEIQMDFQIDVPTEMGGNYSLFGYSGGVLALDKFYPVIPVYDDEGWNVEIPPENGDLTYYDVAFYQVHVTAPADLVIATSGVEVAREHQGERQSLTFAAGPARDFYLAASEEYVVLEESIGETTIRSYAPMAYQHHAGLLLGFAEDALRSFNRRFGPYPYTEFDFVSVPIDISGMEYAGIVALGFGLYDPNGQPRGLPSRVLLESITAHETAHQWFYNTVGSDQLDDPWLDEAMAQYSTWLYYLDRYGEEAARSYRQSWEDNWSKVGQATTPIGMPSAAYSKEEYSPIVYGRGPFFLTALEEKMGQKKFDAFLQAYCTTHQWGIATPEEFKRLAEAHCNCDLTSLFEEWVYER